VSAPRRLGTSTIEVIAATGLPPTIRSDADEAGGDAVAEASELLRTCPFGAAVY